MCAVANRGKRWKTRQSLYENEERRMQIDGQGQRSNTIIKFKGSKSINSTSTSRNEGKYPFYIDEKILERSSPSFILVELQSNGSIADLVFRDPVNRRRMIRFSRSGLTLTSKGCHLLVRQFEVRIFGFQRLRKLLYTIHECNKRYVETTIQKKLVQTDGVGIVAATESEFFSFLAALTPENWQV